VTPLRNVARCGLAALLAVVIATTIGVPPAAASGGASDLVIQVNLQRGYSIEDVTRKYGLQVRETLVKRAGIYLVRPMWTESVAVIDLLAGRLDDSTMVTNAAAETRVMSPTRFHSWPDGQSDDFYDGAAAYTEQLAETLKGPHQLSRGHGVTVAVLDTGIDASHPVLRERTVDGYDYIGDDDDPAEERQREDQDANGVADMSYGHGTFVAGLVGLVAPEASIMPMRVLDSDGFGNVVVIAQAMRDAAQDGADVINLSFGTESPGSSPVLERAIDDVREDGAMVVVSAGNRGSAKPLYPGNADGVLSVTCLDPEGAALSDYASWGPWIDVAARGSQLVAPVPDGYAIWSGTSMAAPLVSGQLALIRAGAPKLSLKSQLAAVTKTANPLSIHRIQHGAVDIEASLRFAMESGD
jgi:subtilisin family serine protease